MVMPVVGLMIGMALPRVRVAVGACIIDCWLWKPGGKNDGEDELSEKAGAMVIGCCVGDDSGDKLARDERSEEAIDDLCKVTH
jgi:hypothetical protein